MKKTFYTISLLVSALFMPVTSSASSSVLKSAETVQLSATPSMTGAQAGEKQEAGISFDKTEVEYTIGSSDPFVAPALNNPNNLAVKYATDNWDVARVNEYGEVTIKGAGTAVITATTKENEQFMAGEAKYTITVVDPTIVFVAPFNTDDCGFVEESTNTEKSAWSYSYGSITTYGYNLVTEMTVFYYVSPKFVLDKNSNKVSFEHKISHPNNIQEENQLVIREAGSTEWTLIPDIEYPTSEWSYSSTGEVVIPSQFNGKEVQIAFKYSTDGGNAASGWSIKNLIIKRDIVKAEAGIAFETTEFEYAFGSAEPFAAPAIVNPNNLAVTYTSSDASVASVDETTGEVVINAIGTAVITAATAETDKFMAGSASYTINVVDKSIVFEAPFLGDYCGFTAMKEGDAISEEKVWTVTGMGLNADGFHKFEGGETTAFYMVSPEFTLDEVRNIVSYDERKRYFSEKVSDEAVLVIREVGGEWNVIEMNYKVGNVDQMTSIGETDIPSQFNGKKVQVAFKYVTNGANTQSGIWDIANLVIKRGEPKQDPEIAFAETEVKFELVDENSVFTEPELINPNNVTVKYSSDNAEVATVDEVTGKVTVITGGVVTIKAVSEETDKFASAEASYTLTVKVVPTGIEGVSANDIKNGKVYDLNGCRVNNVVKGGVYVINGKKVILK